MKNESTLIPISDLLHKRLLIVNKGNSVYNRDAVVEVKILEISPSEKWIKIQDQDGRKYWKSFADMQFVELLGVVNKATEEVI